MENTMMENVITEEQVMNTAEEIIEASNDDLIKFLGAAGKVAGVVAVCYLGYKYIAKPALEKRKAKKAEKVNQSEIVEEYDASDVDVENAE